MMRLGEKALIFVHTECFVCLFVMYVCTER